MFITIMSTNPVSPRRSRLAWTESVNFRNTLTVPGAASPLAMSPTGSAGARVAPGARYYKKSRAAAWHRGGWTTFAAASANNR